jgi:hypothetical protein
MADDQKQDTFEEAVRHLEIRGDWSIGAGTAHEIAVYIRLAHAREIAELQAEIERLTKSRDQWHADWERANRP